MLDKNLQALLIKKIRNEIGSNMPSQSKEIEAIKSDMAARGMLRSGATHKRIYELIKGTIPNKSDIISKTIINEIEEFNLPPSDEYTVQLKSIARSLMPKTVESMVHTIHQNLVRIGSPLAEKVKDRYTNDLTITLELCLRRMYDEIDFSLEKLKRRLEAKKNADKSQIINVNAPVNVIQTGDYSIANIAQNFNESSRDSLHKALELIETAIQKEPKLPDYPKEEIVEIIRESQEELKKNYPNISKIKSYLSTIGSAIQTTLSAKEIYGAVIKPAFGLFGINLP